MSEQTFEEKIKKEMEDCSNKFYATVEQIKQLNEQAKALQITYAYLKKLLPQEESTENANVTENKEQQKPTQTKNENRNEEEDTPDYLK